MKVNNSLAIVASILTTLPASHALVQSDWTVTNVPSTGLADITFPITIVEADHISGYYLAQQFAFFGQSDVGYTGIQPRPDNGGRPVLHGVFSSFIDGSITTDANCNYGADNGTGVSCSVEWNGVYGRTYNFELKTTGNRLWVGTAVDTATGERIHIGSYTLPSGTQGIKSSQFGFVEWYPWNIREPENHCALLPYQSTIFGDPFTTNSGSVGTQRVSYETGDCKGQVAFKKERLSEGWQNNCGFRGQTGYMEDGHFGTKIKATVASFFKLQMGQL